MPICIKVYFVSIINRFRVVIIFNSFFYMFYEVTRAARKAIMLVCLTLFSQQLSTNFLMQAYSNRLHLVFELPINMLSVGWAMLQLIGCGIAYLIIEHIGRKV